MLKKWKIIREWDRAITYLTDENYKHDILPLTMIVLIFFINLGYPDLCKSVE